jgi:hypothetical protein
MKLPDIFGFRRRRELLEEISLRLLVLERQQSVGFREVGIIMTYYDGRVYSANNKIRPIEVKATKKQEQRKGKNKGKIHGK